VEELKKKFLMAVFRWEAELLVELHPMIMHNVRSTCISELLMIGTDDCPNRNMNFIRKATP